MDSSLCHIKYRLPNGVERTTYCQPHSLSYGTHVNFKEEGQQWMLLVSPFDEGCQLLLPLTHILAISKDKEGIDKNPWKDAVTEACVVSCIGFSDDPKSTLVNLIQWEIQTALDPAVSSDADALIQKGKREQDVAWAVALAEAVGISSGLRVPLIPSVSSLTTLLEEFKARK